MVFHSLPRNDFSVSNSHDTVKSIDLLNTELHSYMISGNEKKSQFNVYKNIIPVKIKI